MLAKHRKVTIIRAVKVVAAYFVCAIVWGTTWFAIRVCIDDGAYPTILAAALRFTIAAIVLTSIAILSKKWTWPSTQKLKWMALAGLANGIGYSLVYKGEESISGGVAAVIFGTLPLFTALIAVLSKTEKVRTAQILGSLIGVSGVAAIFSDRLSVSNAQAVGVALLLAGVFAAAIYSTILKRVATSFHPMVATSLFLWFTAFVIWTFTIFTHDPFPTEVRLVPTLALFYLALCGSVLTFICYIYLLKRVSLMTTTTLVFIQPLVALSVDALWEKESSWNENTLWGFGLTLLGVFVSVYRNNRKDSVRRKKWTRGPGPN